MAADDTQNNKACLLHFSKFDPVIKKHHIHFSQLNFVRYYTVKKYMNFPVDFCFRFTINEGLGTLFISYTCILSQPRIHYRCQMWHGEKSIDYSHAKLSKKMYKTHCISEHDSSPLNLPLARFHSILISVQLVSWRVTSRRKCSPRNIISSNFSCG